MNSQSQIAKVSQMSDFYRDMADYLESNLEKSDVDASASTNVEVDASASTDPVVIEEEQARVIEQAMLAQLDPKEMFEMAIERRAHILARMDKEEVARKRMIAKYRTGVEILANTFFGYLIAHPNWVGFERWKGKAFIFWSFYQPMRKPCPIEDELMYLNFSYPDPVTGQMVENGMPIEHLVYGPLIEVDGVRQHNPLQSAFVGHAMETVEQIVNRKLPKGIEIKILKDLRNKRKFQCFVVKPGHKL